MSEARPLIEEAQTERLINQEAVVKEALASTEADGIVFIDEIDKIVVSSESRNYGSDASSEGVQRDLLPIIEGSTVSTKCATARLPRPCLACLRPIQPREYER